ncbi:MAG TPA: Rnf-Nqr domain containing protein [Rectinemataceae bacterium]|nr:Rnf-Nqr domain containing protein [Rectinemataceae bacterium]
MSASDGAAAIAAAKKPLLGAKEKQTFWDGFLNNNPIFAQVLGICSALAVTSKLENSIIMGLGYFVILSLSTWVVSILRGTVPHRIRIIVQVLVVCIFVIVLDLGLKAFYWQGSKQLGPYVALMITNTLTLGRTEGFSIQNKPMLALVDGIGNGAGYAIVLIFLGALRELLGSGTLLGYTILPASIYMPNQIFILAPGAFFALGALIAFTNYLMSLGKKGAKK